MTKPAAELEAEAATWLARRDSGLWSEADEAALADWRTSSTAHHVALLRLETTWNKADRLRVLEGGEVPVAPGERIAPAIPPGSRRKRRWYFPAAVAASLAVLAVPAWHLLDGPRSEIYATAVGGFQRVPLADGSRVEINTDTELEVAMSDAERHISLERGEAYFKVAHDASRPFVVEAGDLRVTAVGTAFSVRRDRGRTLVAVTEGRVRIDRRETDGTTPLMFVVAGQRVAATPAAPVAVQNAAATMIEQELSWRDGLLTFEETRLSDVAAEFNRYNRRQLVVDPAAANVAISGTFRANNLDGFLRLLHEGFDVDAARRGDGEIVLRPS